MYIKRAIEIILNKNFLSSKALVITGARQVGKTTITRHLFPNVKRINMMDSRLINMSKEDPYAFISGFGRPLFIDEVQEAPYILKEIKVILDEIKAKGNYILSGSQKWQLMQGISDSLAGIVSVLEMSTLSMREIENIDFNMPFSLNDTYITKREKAVKKYNDIWYYIHKGFYPELYDDNVREISDYYRDYVSTYIARDVYNIIKVKDQNLFFKFLVAVAARTGNILNYSNIAGDIGIDSETIKSWVSVLEMTGIIYTLKPYYNSYLKRSIKTPKIYFRDTGLAAYLTNWLTKEQLRDGAMNGAFFETFIINEIIKSYINAGMDYSKYIYYYRGKDKVNDDENGEQEIDFIIEENNTLYPIEIKKNSNVNANMTKAFKILDKDVDKKRGRGAIICTSDYKINLNEKLMVLPVEYI